MKIDILTLFPEMIEAVANTSILHRAQKKELVAIKAHQLRDWAADSYGAVDDTPYGGGPGMVLKVDVIDRALADLAKSKEQRVKRTKTDEKTIHDSRFTIRPHIVLMTPQGKRFAQADAKRLAKKKHLIFVAGHYEGFDERVRSLVDEELSIGDYVLTGGELPALVIADAVVRLLPGVLGKDASSHDESFSIGANGESQIANRGLLEYAQYTRPESYAPISKPRKRALMVPEILKSGHHAKITEWRLKQAQERTKKRRPDLLDPCLPAGKLGSPAGVKPEDD